MASMASTSGNSSEADPDFESDTDDAISACLPGLESDLTSLISAARNHVFENGRRYHGYKEGKYTLPNDEAEQDRLDLYHHCCLLALRGELFVSPVGEDWNPHRILDLGTGSGIWAIDMADKYPSAEVIGVDLSPIQPNLVPSNISFEVDDIEEIWLYQDNSFDFIHIRHMSGFIYDWPKLYYQAFKALKPGGWIEVQDFCDFFCTDDGSLPPESVLNKWIELTETCYKMTGREWLTIAPGMDRTLRNVGYVDVAKKQIKIPLGLWAKSKHEQEIGMYCLQHILDGAEGFTMAGFTRVLGWEKEEVDVFLANVRTALRNPLYHMYGKFYCTYGRKPMV